MASAGLVIVVAVLAAVIVGGSIVFLVPGLLTEDEPELNIASRDNNDKKVGSTVNHLTTGDKVEIECINKDSLTNNGLTEGSAVQCTQLGKGDNGFYLLSTGTDQVIDVDNDNGYVYINFQEISGQGWILDVEQLYERNPSRIVDIEYGDWDDDNDNGYIVTFNTNNMKPQEVLDSVPILQLKVPWDDENTISLNNPDDQSSLGTSPRNIDIYWEGTGTEGDVTYYKDLKLEVNSTDAESEIDEGDSWVTFEYHDSDGDKVTKKLLLTAADDVQYTTSLTRWVWKVGEDFSEAPYYEFREGQSTKTYFTTRLDLDLDTSDVRTANLIVDTWDAAETPNTAVNNSITLSA